MTHSYFISHKAISNCMLYVCVMKPSTNCYYKISAENSRGRKTTVRNQVITHSRAGQNCVRFPISSTGSFSIQSQAFPSHSHSNSEAARKLESFFLCPQMGWTYFGKRIQWAFGLDLLVLVFVLNKFYGNASAESHVASMSYQGGKCCPLSGVPLFMALSQKLDVLPKGQSVNQECIRAGENRADTIYLAIFHISG